MKIVCEGCGARYSIGDDVVAGRAVRARCKRCGGTIAVGGSRAATDPPVNVAEAPRIAQPAPTGARNESSVLFSPRQLGVLAAQAARPLAGAEGSGLIDIRALAGTLAHAGSARSAPARADDVLGIGTPPIGATLLGAPVPAPIEPPRGRAIVAAVAIASTGLVLAACVLAIAITRSRASADPLAAAPAIVAPVATQETDVVPVIRIADGPGRPETSPSATDGTEPVSAARTPSERRVAAPIRARARVDAEREAAPAEAQREVRDERAARATDRADHGARRTGEPALGELIDDVVGEERSARRPADPPAQALAATPSRAEVTRALDAVRPAVSACDGGEHGTAVVAITIGGATGRVTSATVTGAFAGTPVGSCIARAVRAATFPPFARPGLTIQFPFRI